MAELPQTVDAQLSSTVFGKVILFNTSEEELDNQVNGEIYRLKPGAQITIDAIMRHPVDKSTGRRQTGLAKEAVLTADQVARHLLLVSGWYERGVTPIFGNDLVDAEAKKKAHERYVKYRVARAMIVQNRWLTEVKEVQRIPGSLPPVMPERIRQDLEFLQRWQAQALRSDRKRYISEIDGYQSDDLEEMKAYITKNYSDHLQIHNDPLQFIHDLEAQRKGTQAQFAKARAKALQEAASIGEVVAPMAQQTDEVEALVARAEKLEVNLTKADYKGLALRDPETLKAIADRLSSKEEKT
jgi:hypothetical protein